MLIARSYNFDLEELIYDASPEANSDASSHVSLKVQQETSTIPEGSISGKVQGEKESGAQLGGSTSSASGSVNAFSASHGPGLSPSSSVGSLSSEKSTLNPHAKVR